MTSCHDSQSTSAIQAMSGRHTSAGPASGAEMASLSTVAAHRASPVTMETVSPARRCFFQEGGGEFIKWRPFLLGSCPQTLVRARMVMPEAPWLRGLVAATLGYYSDVTACSSSFPICLNSATGVLAVADLPWATARCRSSLVRCS